MIFADFTFFAITANTNSFPTVKYLAAYLLLTSAGKTPSAEDITAVLSSVGIEVEEDRLSLLLSELEGKDINELIAQGSEKLASVPTGGAVGAAAGGAGAAAAPAEAAEEEAAPAEEEKEESDDDMGFGLFD
ncbi:ribosomal protein 60S [Lipomyces kononenkoae]